MAGFSSIIEGCRNIYCDSPFVASASLDIKGADGLLKGGDAA